MKEKTLKEKVKQRLERSKISGFLISDFYDLVPHYKEQYKIDKKKAIKNASSQIGRVMKKLEEENVVAKIGYGVYGKLRWSNIVKGFILNNGLLGVAKEILVKMNTLSEKEIQAVKDYNNNTSTQVPTGRVFAVNKNITREIKYDGVKIYYELQTN